MEIVILWNLIQSKINFLDMSKLDLKSFTLSHPSYKSIVCIDL
jgi:hypothetical protein